jgi:antitoxin VapB
MVAPGAWFYHIIPGIYLEVVMGTQLNIKSEDAYRLASRLSELTGESLTTVVTKALRTELEREQRLRDKAALRAKLLALADAISANMAPGVTSDHNWLYDDETGLPR